MTTELVLIISLVAFVGMVLVMAGVTAMTRGTVAPEPLRFGRINNGRGIPEALKDHRRH